MNQEINIHMANDAKEYQALIAKELEHFVQNNKKDVSKLLEILDDFELNIRIAPHDYTSEIGLLHILVYFISWDLDNLRFLIKRLKVFNKIIFVDEFLKK